MNPLERISKWFTRRECTRSEIAAREGIANEPNAAQWAALIFLMVNVMDRIRDLCGVPIRPTSVFRNPIVNKKAKGSKNSQHMSGEACDFLPLGWIVKDTMRLIIANDIPFDQLIDEYGAWVHISVKATGKNRGEIFKYRKVYNPNTKKVETVKTYLTRDQVLLPA